MASSRHYMQPLDLNRMRVAHSPRLPVVQLNAPSNATSTSVGSGTTSRRDASAGTFTTNALTNSSTRAKNDDQYPQGRYFDTSTTTSAPVATSASTTTTTTPTSTCVGTPTSSTVPPPTTTSTTTTGAISADPRSNKVEYYRQMLRSRTHPKEHRAREPDAASNTITNTTSTSTFGMSNNPTTSATETIQAWYSTSSSTLTSQATTTPNDLPSVSTISSTSSMSSQSLASPEDTNSDYNSYYINNVDPVDRLNESLESTLTMQSLEDINERRYDKNSMMQRQLTGGDGDDDSSDVPTSSSNHHRYIANTSTPTPAAITPTTTSAPARPSSVRTISKTIHWEIPLYMNSETAESSQTTFDSDPFVFLNHFWRFTFTKHSEYSHGVYLVLLSPTKSPLTIQLGCEFRLHCLLRPTYSLRANADYFYGQYRPKVHGFEHFIGPKLSSYVNNEGCVLMSGVLTSCPEDI